MKCIKKIILALVLSVFMTINVNASVIKESSSSYTGDVYIFGGTKFDNDTIITFAAAGIAGMNEAKIQLALNHSIDTTKVDTLYYSDLTESWSRVELNSGKLTPLTESEALEVEKNLNIFFVNNKEKELEIPFDGVIDEGSIYPSNQASGKARYENGKIIVPATWICGFSFTSEGVNATVDLSKFDQNANFESELDEPVVKIAPKFTLNLPKKMYLNEESEFTISVKANNYEGKELTLMDTSTMNYSYFNGTEWVEFKENEIGNKSIKIKLTDGDIKLKVTPKFLGTSISFSFGWKVEDLVSYELRQNADVVLSPDVIATDGVNYYKSLQDAIDKSKNSYITLVRDVEVTERINISYNRDITIDLGGHTISGNISNNNLMFIYSFTGNTLSIYNGTIKNTADSDYGIIAFGATKTSDENDVTDFNNAKLVLANNLTVDAVGQGVIVMGTNLILDVIGTIKSQNGFAISGNYYNQYMQNPEINILVGANVISENETAIYMPSYMKVNVNGGTVSGKTGIGMKLGELNVISGHINGVGDYVNDADLKEKSGGINPTGDAIYVEVSDGYYNHYKKNTNGSPINITVNGGEISSTSGNIIREYNTTQDYIKMTGTYETREAKENNAFVYSDTSRAALEVNGIKYDVNSFNYAVDELKKDNSTNEMNILSDFTINELLYFDYTKDTTLNLNGHTISASMNSNMLFAYSFEGKTLTIKNGKIVNYDNSPYGLIQYGSTRDGEDDFTDFNNARLVISDDVTIDAMGIGVSVFGSNINIDVYGTVISRNRFAISGNYDSQYKQNPTVNIYDGATVTADGDTAIYMPSYMTVNISGGTISGLNVVGMKLGVLNITGGEIKAYGEKVLDANLEKTVGKINPTGDAIYVEVNDAYYGHYASKTNVKKPITISIFGENITSVNGNIIREYNLLNKDINVSGNYSNRVASDVGNVFVYTK